MSDLVAVASRRVVLSRCARLVRTVRCRLGVRRRQGRYWLRRNRCGSRRFAGGALTGGAGGLEGLEATFKSGFGADLGDFAGRVIRVAAVFVLLTFRTTFLAVFAAERRGLRGRHRFGRGSFGQRLDQSEFVHRLPAAHSATPGHIRQFRFGPGAQRTCGFHRQATPSRNGRGCGTVFVNIRAESWTTIGFLPRAERSRPVIVRAKLSQFRFQAAHDALWIRRTTILDVTTTNISSLSCAPGIASWDEELGAPKHKSGRERSWQAWNGSRENRFPTRYSS